MSFEEALRIVRRGKILAFCSSVSEEDEVRMMVVMGRVSKVLRNGNR